MKELARVIVTCSRCGGEGGEETAEGEWHPCYHCREEGECSCDECRDRAAAAYFDELTAGDRMEWARDRG